jgi:hypothetical protein
MKNQVSSHSAVLTSWLYNRGTEKKFPITAAEGTLQGIDPYGVQSGSLMYHRK